MNYFISERPIKKQWFSHKEISKMINEPEYLINFWAIELKIKRRYGSGKTGIEWKYNRLMVKRFHEIKELYRNQDWTLQRLKVKFGIIKAIK